MTDWVLVMVPGSCNASIDANPSPVLERRLVATRDPEGENAGWKDAASALPTVSVAESEEPSVLCERMTDPVPARATQATSALPAKNREPMAPQLGLKEWTRACSVTFHTLISPFDPPDANRLELVREKENVAETARLPRRIFVA
jgi:hypothetical protein